MDRIYLDYKVDEKDDEIVYDLPDVDSNSWLGLAQQEFIPNKEEYVVKRLVEEFPPGKDLDYDKFMALCSRSSYLSDKLAAINVEWSLSIKVPEYFKGLITKEERRDIEGYLQEHKAKLNKITYEKDMLSKEYKANIKLLEDQEKIHIKDLRQSNIFEIMTLQQNQLPLSIQMAIVNYVPVSDDTSVSSKVFAREALINYQLSLFKFVKKHDKAQVSKYINSFLPK